MTTANGSVKKKMTSTSLAIIALNVGDGDSILVRFPAKYGNKNSCAVVDCCNSKKTIAALEDLNIDHIPFLCVTHPHYDHNKGVKSLIKWCLKNEVKIDEFWDSGFRHVSKTHYDIIQLLRENPDIKVIQPTSGFETTINRVRILVLSPSIYLKNRYDTFGTNINNASIVLKLDYPPKDIAPYYLDSKTASENDLAESERIKQNTVILGGDAQFDAWARITQEFPELISTNNRAALIDPSVKKHKPLKCQVLKIPHHMSKHGISLEVVETLRPTHSLVSCGRSSRHKFPHELADLAVMDIVSKENKKKGKFGIYYTGHRNKKKSSGTLVAILQGGSSRPVIYGLGEKVFQDAPL